ncbi:MAG: exodeoxyribonuclease VII large subunit [Chitinophagales bacterium]
MNKNIHELNYFIRNPQQFCNFTIQQLFMTSLTLSELNEKIDEALYGLSSRSTWVMAEIAELKSTGAGHIYLDLIEKEQNKIIAKSSATIWYNTGLLLRRKFGRSLSQILKKGNRVLVSAKVSYHAVYGLKLNIIDLDASATIGDLELRRLETIRKLQEEGYTNVNNRLELPLVLQRIAVISSPTAAGYGDFVNQLENNPYGYQIHHHLFPSAMQGDNMETEMRLQLQQIAEYQNRFDAIVIIRGGGSKLDLESFNSYELAKTIALHPLPILTGIGHQQDETVADLVAHTSIKTPTAVAEYILDTYMQFEQQLYLLGEQIQQNTQRLLTQQQYLLNHIDSRLQSKAIHLLQNEQVNIAQLQARLNRSAQQRLKRENLQLQLLERTFQLFNVETLLQRGFSITRKNGMALKNIHPLKKGDVVETELANGTVKSKVI